MHIRRTSQPLPCPTVHAHNGLFARRGGRSSKQLEQVSCMCVCRVVRMFEWTGEGWVQVCYRPSDITIMARVAARTPITVWLVLASDRNQDRKRRLKSKRGFYSDSIVTVRLLGVYLTCVYIFLSATRSVLLDATSKYNIITISDGTNNFRPKCDHFWLHEY